MTHRERDEIRRARQPCLAYRNGAIAVLVELRKELPEAHAPRARDDAQRAVWPSPPPGVLREQLLRHATALERSDPSRACGSNGCAARNCRRSKKDDSPRWLIWILFQETIDHQPAQAMPDEMQRGRCELPDAGLQLRRDVRHARRHTPIMKPVHRDAQLALDSLAQHQ